MEIVSLGTILVFGSFTLITGDKSNSTSQLFHYDHFGYKINWTNLDDGWTEKGRRKFLEFEQKNKGE